MSEIIGMLAGWAVEGAAGYLAVSLWLDGAFNDTGGTI